MLFFLINVLFVTVISMAFYVGYRYCQRRIQRALLTFQERRDAQKEIIREVNQLNREWTSALSAQWHARITEHRQFDETVKTLSTVPAVARRDPNFLRSVHEKLLSPQLQLPLDGVPTLRRAVIF